MEKISYGVVTTVHCAKDICHVESPLLGNNTDVNLNKTVAVQTNLGTVLGTTIQTRSGPIYRFYKVPYALPPIGPRRYLKPESLEKWSSIIDGREQGPSCLQYFDEFIPRTLTVISNFMSEDCLHLSIWTPRIDADNLLPVIVVLHGGAFYMGTTYLQQLNGNQLSSIGDVVVVSINSRVGALGYLTVPNTEINGNQGLWDQALAFKWIKENIDKFGGNPEEMTILGEGTGALAATLHLISPISKTLFKRAILQSGSPAVLKMVYKNSETSSLIMVNESKCLSNQKDLLTCLQLTPITEIIKATIKIKESTLYPFMPNLQDQVLFPNMNKDVLESENGFSHLKDVLIGVTKNEGAIIFHQLFPKNFPPHSTNEYVDKLLGSSIDLRQKLIVNIEKKFGHMSETNKKMMVNAVFGRSKRVTRKILDKLEDILTTQSVTGPVINLANKISGMDDKRVYFYLFNQKASNR